MKNYGEENSTWKEHQVQKPGAGRMLCLMDEEKDVNDLYKENY
jgi:hypothetical protein